MMRRWLPLAVPLLLLLAACRGDAPVGDEGCRVDSDCGTPSEAYRCDTETSACRCRTDGACAPGELCNEAGFCQDRAGCESNADCGEDSLFCDTSTGTCLTRGRCATDLHCALGEVCDLARTTCVAGCRTSGDCAGTACRCDDAPCLCDATTPEGRAACALGVCDASFCADARDCAFGESCGTPSGAEAGTCFSDFDPVRRPYCANCTYGGGLQVCGRGANFCLRETASPGTAFCGADCSEGQGCPHGYQCSDVVVVASRARCRSDAQCAPSPSLPCREDSHCGRGGRCVKSDGQPEGACAGRCSIAEGDVEGFCSCQQDTDCVQDACSQGTCTVSRRSCVGDADCRPIRCVDHEGAGGCFVGRNCAPEEGLTCAEVAPRFAR
ncbi:hypothetical protein [Myxococcus sp. CA040A]|uniref:hypothetical protein n=1 Tax=Myxococcus sp. CA040A TaxID=2741738 RepID=UPI00157B2A45|nr:hypothetical protein [Myxococcus sp. CA040A]NTX02830.1 hypothetical protein [Myxococcus sp. CA040A]